MAGYLDPRNAGIADNARRQADTLRQKMGKLTPIEEREKEVDEQSIAYFKEQRELIADQKKYTKAIYFATWIMVAATIAVAFFTAIIALK